MAHRNPLARCSEVVPQYALRLALHLPETSVGLAAGPAAALAVDSAGEFCLQAFVGRATRALQKSATSPPTLLHRQALQNRQLTTLARCHCSTGLIRADAYIALPALLYTAYQCLPLFLMTMQYTKPLPFHRMPSHDSMPHT